MKRQSIGRRGSEESQRPTVSENKRLKVFHPQEENLSNFELEAGSGSDSTEEYININGQERSLKASAHPGSSSTAQESSETSLLNDSPMQNIFPTAEEQSAASNHVNGQYGDTNENLPPNGTSNKTCVNGSTETSSEESASVINHTNNHSDNGDSQHQENIVSEMTGPFQGSNSDFTSSYKQSFIQEHYSTSHNEESEFGQESSETIQQHITEKNTHEAPMSDETSSKNCCDEKLSNDDVSSPFDGLKEHSSSNHKKNYPQNTDDQVATTSKKCIDIENITLCQLKVTQLDGHADVVFCVAADEDFILSSSGDTTVKVWNVEVEKEISNFAGHNAAVTSVILLNSEESEILKSKLNCSEISRIAVSASYDCHIRLWSVLDGHEISSIYTFNSIICMGFLKNQMYVVVGTEGGKLEVWDLHLAKLVHFVYAHDSSVSSLKVHDCYIYSTSKDGTVKVWLFDDEELQPLYTRRRKEIIAGSSDFGPTQWQSVAVYNDILFLGDNTCRLKALDWRMGRLRLFSNQPDNCGICEAVLAKGNILLTTFFDTTTDTGGINVWRLPEMTYVGTLTGDLQEICSLALIESEEKLRIVSGGHQLVIWDFDFSKPPQKSSQDPFFVCEVDKIGSEVNEESVEMRSPSKNLSAAADENVETKKSWCNIS